MRDPGTDPWSQRLTFRRLVDEWMIKEGKSKKDFALAVRIAPESLKQYYSGRHLPGRDLVLRFASTLGCSPSMLLGDPSAPGGEDPEAQAFGNIMGVLGKNLTPEMRAVMIDMARAAQARGFERLKAEADLKVAEETAPYRAGKKKAPKS